jgi:hypothetical protein
MYIHDNEWDPVEEVKFMVQMHSSLMMCFCTGLPFGIPDMTSKAVQ